MNDFEKLLHGVLDRTDTFLDASYTGRACYPRLSNDLRIKAEFIYTSVKDHYCDACCPQNELSVPSGKYYSDE